MRAGELDRKITIQRRSVTVSPSGVPSESWANLSVRHSAGLKPLRGTEGFILPEQTAHEQVEFRVRYSTELADLSPLDRIVYPALTEAQAADSGYVIPERTIYDVLGVLEIGRREGLRIISTRRPDLNGG